MPAATAAERHAARARTARRASRLPRRVSGPSVAAARGSGRPRPVTGVFERVRALPDHRVVDRLLRGRVWIWLVGDRCSAGSSRCRSRC